MKVTIYTDSLFNSATAFYNRDKAIIAKEHATVDNCDIPMSKIDSLTVDFAQFHIPADVRTFVKEKKILLRNS